MRGNTYKGEFANNRRNGHGVYTFVATGMVYTGAWKDNLYHGEGTLQDDVGTYVGTFVCGKKHGLGKFHDNRKNKDFDGTWENNRWVGGAVSVSPAQNTV